MRTETGVTQVDTPAAGSRRLALGLLWLTLAWNVGEGVVAVGSGLAAESVALVGFGLDSFIEVIAAAALLWRLQLPDGSPSGRRRDLVALRLIGATFFALAAYIAVESAVTLAGGREAEASGWGLGIATASLVVMPPLGLVKRWNALRFGSAALTEEATETLICAYLSAALFVGVGLNAAFGWWWADVAAALAMVPWIMKEGFEGLRGED